MKNCKINYVIGVIIAATMLTGCGSSSMIATGDASAALAQTSDTKTFKYTGGSQRFVVPSGVTQLTIDARGAQGAGVDIDPSDDPPGFPGRVLATIAVQSGQTLYVVVGGSGARGGFNGGGAGGASGKGDYKGNDGGGASDVRVGGKTLSDRIIVAAGGGGSGLSVDAYGYSAGGNGGGLSGKAGGTGGQRNDGVGGTGGSQSAGGTGGEGGHEGSSYSKPGAPGIAGALGSGGAGGSAEGSSGSGCVYAGGGGGGGGGYYGGGGGGAGVPIAFYGCRSAGQGGGGGGGSSYVESTAIKSKMWAGWKEEGDGLVTLSW